MVFGNFFDSEDAQVRFNLKLSIYNMDLRLNFTQEVMTTTVTSMTSIPTTMAKVINEMTSTQGFL